MCGEHEKILLYGDAIPGSSPHVRGALDSGVNQVERTGIIPACAGSTVCVLSDLFAFAGSSPHVRGALDFPRQRLLVLGIIPACAGST